MLRCGYSIWSHSAKSSFMAYRYSSLDLKGLKGLASKTTVFIPGRFFSLSHAAKKIDILNELIWNWEMGFSYLILVVVLGLRCRERKWLFWDGRDKGTFNDLYRLLFYFCCIRDDFSYFRMDGWFISMIKSWLIQVVSLCFIELNFNSISVHYRWF